MISFALLATSEDGVPMTQPVPKLQQRASWRVLSSVFVKIVSIFEYRASRYAAMFSDIEMNLVPVDKASSGLRNAQMWARRNSRL